MLLPALQQARENGKKISCVNNFITLGKIVTLYSDDNTDYYPYPSSGYATYYWDNASPSINYTGWCKNYFSWKYTEEWLGGINKNGTTYEFNSLVCPAVSTHHLSYKSYMPGPFGVNRPDTLNYRFLSMGVNRYLFRAAGVPIKRVRVKKPSILFAYADCSGFGSFDYRARYHSDLASDDSSTNQALGLRHLDSTVVLFGDMHASAIREQSIPSYKYGSHYDGPTWNPLSTREY